jgi:hypothetical protein
MQSVQPVDSHVDPGVDPGFLAHAHDCSVTLAQVGAEIHGELARTAETLPSEWQPIAKRVLRAPVHVTVLFFVTLGSPVTTFLTTCFWTWRIVYVLTPAIRVFLAQEGYSPASARAEVAKRIADEYGNIIAALFVGALLSTIISAIFFILTTSPTALCCIPLAGASTWFLSRSIVQETSPRVQEKRIAEVQQPREAPPPYSQPEIATVHYPELDALSNYFSRKN